MASINNFTIGKYIEATGNLDPHITLLKQEQDSSFSCLFPACRCKDFFNEVFLKIHTGKDSWIYDFNTQNVNVEGLKDSEYFYLLFVARAEAYNLSNIQNFLDLFNPKSEIIESNIEKGFIVKFHRNWTDRPYLLSMFLNLCRIGTLYNNEGWESFKALLAEKGIFWKQNCVSNECLSQIGNSISLIEDYLGGIVHEQTYEQYSNTTELHNYSGAVSFAAKLKENEKNRTAVNS